MKMRRLVLPVQEARPGMRLVAEVRNAAGGVLLAAGAVLAEDALAGLRRRGIDAVSVEVPDARSEEEVARELAQAEARIEHLFHRHIDNPELRELKQIVLDYRRKSLA
jgi:hypothetical protein